jgi:hypothetical protein
MATVANFLRHFFATLEISSSDNDMSTGHRQSASERTAEHSCSTDDYGSLSL